MYAAKSLSAFCLHLFDCGERLDCGDGNMIEFKSFPGRCQLRKEQDLRVEHPQYSQPLGRAQPALIRPARQQCFHNAGASLIRAVQRLHANGVKKRFGNHVLCQDEYLYARRNHNRKPQQCDLSLIRMRRL